MNTPDYQRAPTCSVCSDTDVWALVIESSPVCEHCVRKHHPKLIEDAFKADDPFPLSARDFTPIDKLVNFAVRVGHYEAMIEAHGREVEKLVHESKHCVEYEEHY